MDKNTLQLYISQGLSSREIAKIQKCSQTNIRHWLRKYGLNTLPDKEKFLIKNPTRNSINPNCYENQKNEQECENQKRLI